jgi:regulator of protease activity HflC (stomatin/prohibitin superfamily)
MFVMPGATSSITWSFPGGTLAKEAYMNWQPTAVALIAIVIIVLLAFSVRIANEYERGVVFRLGRLAGTRGPGLYLLLPFIEWQIMIDLRIVTAAVEQQVAITKDNVPVKVDAVVWYCVVDPARAVVRVKEVYTAVTQISLTTLRNIIGRHTLDDVLKEKDKLSEEMRKTIDDVTEPWGVQVQMVEMKDVVIPESMQRAMAQEAEALREKRARIIKAEAEMEAAERLRDASQIIMDSPAGLELRRMQMITEVGAEQNSMTVVMMPSEFVSMARAISEMKPKDSKKE